jgi:hypothetical protein
MSATDPIDFQRRVGQATPEQRAAIEQVLRAAPGEPGGGGKQDDQSGQAADADMQLDTLVRIDRKLDAVLAWIAQTRVEPDIRDGPGAAQAQVPPLGEAEAGTENLGLAARVFRLLSALDLDNRCRKAPPIKVFNLYYRQGLQPAEIARQCKCHRSLIFDRLETLRKQLPWKPQQLREVSSQVEAMEDAVQESRARHIHRKAAIEGNEDTDEP